MPDASESVIVKQSAFPSDLTTDRSPNIVATTTPSDPPASVILEASVTASTAGQKRRSLLMIVVFTLLSAAAQVFMKFGTNYLRVHPSLMGVLTDVPLICGLALYGVGAALMVLALRHGELSVLYPLISLSYVWVAVLSVVVFGEIMNPYRIAGITVIMTGVAILGRGAHK
jgi:drug/metabolite transporter (DMT)-like permease